MRGSAGLDSGEECIWTFHVCAHTTLLRVGLIKSTPEAQSGDLGGGWPFPFSSEHQACTTPLSFSVCGFVWGGGVLLYFCLKERSQVYALKVRVVHYQAWFVLLFALFRLELRAPMPGVCSQLTLHPGFISLSLFLCRLGTNTNTRQRLCRDSTHLRK